MTNHCKIMLSIAILLGMILCAVARPVEADAPVKAGIRPDGRLRFIDPAGNQLASIAIEIADTAQSHATGLMGRTGLDDTMGMLFIFRKPEQLSFWMHDTPTPLDIVFVSAQSVVINIAAGTQPNSDTIYSSLGPAQYVVEVPAFFCARRRVAPGARIEWRRLGP